MKRLLSISIGVIFNFAVIFYVSAQDTSVDDTSAQDTSSSDNEQVSPDLNIRQQTEKKSQASAKTNWREKISDVVPEEICAEETWHRQCFNLRESQCLSATMEVVDDCIDYVQTQQKKKRHTLNDVDVY